MYEFKKNVNTYYVAVSPRIEAAVADMKSQSLFAVYFGMHEINICCRNFETKWYPSMWQSCKPTFNYFTKKV